MTRVNDRLREAITQRRVTPYWLSTQVRKRCEKQALPVPKGASLASMYRFLTVDAVEPDEELLRAVAPILKVRYEWLASGEYPMNLEPPVAVKVSEPKGKATGPFRVINEMMDAFEEGFPFSKLEQDSVARAKVMETLQVYGRQEVRKAHRSTDVEKRPAAYMGDPILPDGQSLQQLASRLSFAIGTPLKHMGVDMASPDVLERYVIFACITLQELVPSGVREGLELTTHLFPEEEREEQIFPTASDVEDLVLAEEEWIPGENVESKNPPPTSQDIQRASAVAATARACLLQVARDKRLVGYSDLWERVGEEHDWLGPLWDGELLHPDVIRCLKAVNDRSRHDGEFMLSALIVSGKTRMPGQGFFAEAQDRGLMKKRGHKKVFWKKQIDACYEWGSRPDSVLP